MAHRTDAAQCSQNARQAETNLLLRRLCEHLGVVHHDIPPAGQDLPPLTEEWQNDLLMVRRLKAQDAVPDDPDADAD